MLNHVSKAAAHLVSEGSPEEVEPPEEEEAGLCDEPVMEPKSDLTCGITAAFNTFKTELEQHFTVSTHLLHVMDR